jgi:hypothetical protein
LALSPTSSRGSSSGTAALTLLSTTTLAVDGLIDVSGINGAYNDLVLVAVIRSTVAGVVETPGMRFNNDSGANYDFIYNYVQAGTATPQSSSGAAQTYMPLGWALPGNTATAGRFGIFTVEIPGYASTAWQKEMTSLGAGQGVTSNYTASLVGAQWRSTAAITRIQLAGNTAFTTNLLTGSQLRIYGRL